MQEPRTFRLPQVRQHLCPVHILKVDVKQLGSDRYQVRKCTDRRVAELPPQAAVVAAPHCGPRRRRLECVPGCSGMWRSTSEFSLCPSE